VDDDPTRRLIELSRTRDGSERQLRAPGDNSEDSPRLGPGSLGVGGYCKTVESAADRDLLAHACDDGPAIVGHGAAAIDRVTRRPQQVVRPEEATAESPMWLDAQCPIVKRSQPLASPRMGLQRGRSD
jgi:hypothetical protein